MAKKRILIVEDDQTLVEMYKEKLKLEGFLVSTAMDGKKAISKIKQGADLILLDILMPGLNGFEVLKKIRLDDNNRLVPVLVLTNIGSESFDSDKKLALSLGATDYMIKALNTPEDVVAKINKILNK
ncbi:MAG: response regulator [Patescibacteria group bacterium]|nr:response regulator [Patescibacteria group bacterium]